MPIAQRVLKKIQEIEAAYYDDLALIETERQGVGLYGEPTPGYDTVIDNVAIRLISIGGRFRTTSETIAGENSMRDSYRMICAVTTPLSVGQRVTIKSTGNIFWIASIQSDLTNKTHQEAFITRQRGIQ